MNDDVSEDEHNVDMNVEGEFSEEEHNGDMNVEGVVSVDVEDALHVALNSRYNL